MQMLFKIFAFLAIFALFHFESGATAILKNNQPETRTKFDDDLREFVEFIKLQMVCGYPAADIPPLAPYTTEFHEFSIHNNAIDLLGNFTQLTINGLNQFDIIELDWNNVLQKMKFNFNFNEIEIKSFYKMNADTRMFGSPVHVFGDGIFNLLLRNLRASGSFKLRPKLSLSGGLQMWAFNVQLELDSAVSSTTGINNNKIFTKFFNAWVEEFVHLLFKDSPEEVSAAVENLVVPPANRALKQISMVELIALIMGLAGDDVVPVAPIC